MHRLELKWVSLAGNKSCFSEQYRLYKIYPESCLACLWVELHLSFAFSVLCMSVASIWWQLLGPIQKILFIVRYWAIPAILSQKAYLPHLSLWYPALNQAYLPVLSCSRVGISRYRLNAYQSISWWKVTGLRWGCSALDQSVQLFDCMQPVYLLHHCSHHFEPKIWYWFSQFAGNCNLARYCLP